MGLFFRSKPKRRPVREHTSKQARAHLARYKRRLVKKEPWRKYWPTLGSRR